MVVVRLCDVKVVSEQVDDTTLTLALSLRERGLLI